MKKNILFPFVKGKNDEIDELINEILEEHSQIKNFITELDTVENPDFTLNELGILLEKHIRKEERHLFQKIQIHFDDELDELKGKIVSVNKHCDI